MKKYQSSKFNVVGMDCEDEIVAVKEALFSVNGVVEVEPNLITCQISVKFEEGIDPNLLQKKIESTGLKVILDLPERKIRAGLKLSTHTLIVLLSGCFLGTGLLLNAIMPEFNYLIKAIYIISFLSGAMFVFPKAFRSAKSFSLDINVLMVIATLGAAVIGELGESAAVVFLFSLAEWLESFSLQRARKSIRSLLSLVPETALVKSPDGHFLEVSVKEVQVAQIIRVQSGARIPLDGIIKDGRSSVNQAPITGCSSPQLDRTLLI